MDKMKEININIDQTDYKTFSTPSFEKNSNWKKAKECEIKTIIPGTVIDVFVKEGDKVHEGDRMLTIEAMKMNNVFYFDKDAVVKKVFVKPSDIVAKGQMLIEIDS